MNRFDQLNAWLNRPAPVAPACAIGPCRSVTEEGIPRNVPGVRRSRLAIFEWIGGEIHFSNQPAMEHECWVLERWEDGSTTYAMFQGGEMAYRVDEIDGVEYDQHPALKKAFDAAQDNLNN